MELVAKEFYCNQFCSLKPGMSTADYEVPEEVKAQMLADFPDKFDVVGKAPVDDTVVVENQEDKMPKMRKK